MEFTYKTKLVCFAELFILGTVLILVSLKNKSKANKVVVAVLLCVTVLGKYQWFIFSLLCFSFHTDVFSCCTPASKFLCFSIFPTKFLDSIHNMLSAFSAARVCP